MRTLALAMALTSLSTAGLAQTVDKFDFGKDGVAYNFHCPGALSCTAHCGSNEEFVSGGCGITQGGGPAIGHFLVGKSPTGDAEWNCTFQTGTDIIAQAFCKKR